MKKVNAFVKFFSKGSAIHQEDTLRRDHVPSDCWLVVEYEGTAPDGVEIYVLIGNKLLHPSEERAFRQLDFLKEVGKAY